MSIKLHCVYVTILIAKGSECGSSNRRYTTGGYFRRSERERQGQVHRPYKGTQHLGIKTPRIVFSISALPLKPTLCTCCLPHSFIK